MARKTYRVNADSVYVLVDLLVATPMEFNKDNHTLRGREERKPRAGRLNSRKFDSARENDLITYVIYSYDTPIAWKQYVNPTSHRHPGVRFDWVEMWVMPDVRYSVTTSKHQAKVRNALSQISGGFKTP